MSVFFDRPAPKQAVPGDLAGLRDTILRSILGGTAARDQQHRGGVLGDLLGLTSGATPGGDVLGPLRASADTRLNDQINELNASSPGRFSSANIFAQGQLRERSQEDFNLLSAQVLEQGRNRQLAAIQGLLGSALGPTFGGPFTQDPSGWENLLGGISSVANLGNPFGGSKK